MEAIGMSRRKGKQMNQALGEDTISLWKGVVRKLSNKNGLSTNFQNAKCQECLGLSIGLKVAYI